MILKMCVSDYGYYEVDRFGWRYVSRAGVDSGSMDPWLCLLTSVFMSVGYFHWEYSDVGILRWPWMMDYLYGT